MKEFWRFLWGLALIMCCLCIVSALWKEDLRGFVRFGIQLVALIFVRWKGYV